MQIRKCAPACRNGDTRQATRTRDVCQERECRWKTFYALENLSDHYAGAASSFCYDRYKLLTLRASAKARPVNG
jgi:hypothetical protein